jgi:hypothetical protein
MGSNSSGTLGPRHSKANSKGWACNSKANSKGWACNSKANSKGWACNSKAHSQGWACNRVATVPDICNSKVSSSIKSQLVYKRNTLLEDKHII